MGITIKSFFNTCISPNYVGLQLENLGIPQNYDTNKNVLKLIFP